MTKLFIIVNVDYFLLSHRKEVAVAAITNGYDVTIVAKDTGLRGEIEALGLKFIDLPLNRSGMNIFEELHTLRFLYKLYKREKPEIVHHVGLKVILWGTLAAKWVKVKGVVNAISGLGFMFSEDNRSLISKMLLVIMKYGHHQKNLKIIVQNDEDKALFLEKHIVNSKQVEKIKGSGVDLNKFSYTPEFDDGKIKVLFTARMVKEKGVFVLTDAAMKLKPKYGDKVQFLLCGGIDDSPIAIKEEELKAVCDGEYICWLGFRKDVLELLKRCHIVAFPSYYKEGLPKSLIEAAAVGKPIITTRSIGCKDTVEEGYNGFLVPIKDCDALVEKLIVLFDNASLRQEMGRNSRKLAEQDFSIKKVVERHLSIYEILKSRD